jgi:nucleoside-diphosphate-sugar epimerase
MRIVIIGATGHIGTYLVPRLVEAGHEVIVVCRGRRKPYQVHSAWTQVRMVEMDRPQLELEGVFGRSISDLSPDVVVDLICFDVNSARHIVEALQDRAQHLLHCGSMWVHGYKTETPSKEGHAKRPIGDYGLKKAAIEDYLLHEVDQARLAVSIIHPGHIVGPGWMPVNPQGNFNPDVYSMLKSGEEILMAGFGLETLHHVHADDVALGFMLAISKREQSRGQSFHILSGSAITCRGYAEAVAGWYGKEARLRFTSWETFRQHLSEQDAEQSWEHLLHSTSGSIEKAQALLGYQPRYSSLEAIREALGA